VFWRRKILANRRRDERVSRRLRRHGISVIRLWEHDLEARTARVRRILKLLMTPA
jgi:G:T-mismatch repair DNA endonuclease (very short patch repair protein)